MVTNVTSFSRSGLSDFLIQRFSAVILGLYALCVVSFFVVNPNIAHGELVPRDQGHRTLLGVPWVSRERGRRTPARSHPAYGGLRGDR